MKRSLSRSLNKIGYTVKGMGPGLLGMSEMWAFREDLLSPDVVYSHEKKAMVYTGDDKERRMRLKDIASDLSVSFSYLLRLDSERMACSIDGMPAIGRYENTAVHEAMLDMI